MIEHDGREGCKFGRNGSRNWSITKYQLADTLLNIQWSVRIGIPCERVSTSFNEGPYFNRAR